jgi:hypothetical protein
MVINAVGSLTPPLRLFVPYKYEAHFASHYDVVYFLWLMIELYVSLVPQMVLIWPMIELESHNLRMEC